MTRTQNGDSDVCRRCSFLGPTCCRIASGSEEFCFPLSPVEKERIQEHVPYTGGFVLSPNSKAFIDYVCRLFPGEEDAVGQLFPDGKEHFRLAVDSLGACRFLGPLGCEIPQEVRPITAVCSRSGWPGMWSRILILPPALLDARGGRWYEYSTFSI